jgi:hypothetical protein
MIPHAVFYIEFVISGQLLNWDFNKDLNASLSKFELISMVHSLAIIELNLLNSRQC